MTKGRLYWLIVLFYVVSIIVLYNVGLFGTGRSAEDIMGMFLIPGLGLFMSTLCCSIFGNH